MTPELSVILPMHNEARHVGPLLDELVRQMEALARSFEIVCVDDGSSDATADAVAARSASDSRCRLVRLTRNFGKEAAMTAGLAASQGRAVIVMDADMQHPPDLIPALIKRWDEGFDVVEAVKRPMAADRQEALLYRAAARLFYRLMGTSAGRSLHGSSDFKLLDRSVVDAIVALPERARFFRGLVAWVGFRVAQVQFTVAARASGRSNWTVVQLARYALGNVVAFSSVPLRLVAWCGFAIIVLDVLLGVQTFWNWWRGAAVTGFTTVILAVLGLGGLILLSLGVIAIYLAQMYEEIKGRPVYIVQKERTQPVRLAGRDAGSQS